jgi:hypothetical protein
VYIVHIYENKWCRKHFFHHNVFAETPGKNSFLNTLLLSCFCYFNFVQKLQDSLYPASVFLAELNSRQGCDLDLNDPLARPRIPYEILFAVGGWSGGSATNLIETYDVRCVRKLSSYLLCRYLGERSYSFCSFLISALDGGEWSVPHPNVALPPGEKTPGIHWTGGWVRPRTNLIAEAKREIL